MPSNRNGDVCMQIIPTTGLKKIFTEAEERIKKIRGSSSWIQVDVCDGYFTVGKTFELELINEIDTTIEEVLWDVHLMVKEPERWLEKCYFIGASRIIGQVEMMKDFDDFINKVKNEGLEAGLAFDIDTEVRDIPKETDLVLLMGRKAGFGYFDFEKKVLDKIKQVKEKGFRVGVDGGVDLENIELIKKAGADIVYSETNYWSLKENNDN